ncbi:MAG: Triose phosphate isomerase [Streblomastix strix]|uniref:Triosephosphate isomerase n=2 Tax=Streblomastix strix TaxID=222440 RepID=A0A5J4UHH7_9EUKA|nr:MAG: Triose phosphate isomerase [Streblomastix strix]
MPRKGWVGGNWKTNGTKKSVEELVKILNKGVVPFHSKVDIAVAPPHIWLTKVLSDINKNIVVSAQDVNQFGNGAYTGSHSSEILLDAGIKTTLVGHSERRDIFHETDEEIGLKVKKAQEAGLTVIACLGEHKAERDAGKTNDIIFAQIKHIADNVVDWNRLVIAYEPVWAIGTGVVATPDQAQEAHAALRGWIREHVSAEVAEKIRIAYGGSVSAANSAELAKLPDVDGFLVGGASLKPDFVTIVKNLADAH